MHISSQQRSFTYLGGKFSVLPWLLKLLPKAYSFVDVFGGSASVILNREPSPIDTYNDINKHVVNFFKVLRQSPEDLIRQLELTPHSRFEYDTARITVDDSDMEQARKFFVRSVQSMLAAGNMENRKGWRAATGVSRTNISEATSKYLGSVNALATMIERLRGIQIENRDFRWILSSYDTPGTLFYCDPPYWTTHRSSTKYENEMSDQDYRDLADISKNLKGRIAISGYQCDFMNEIFSHLFLKIGPKRKNGLSKKDVRECLWTNYIISDPITLF